MGIFFLFIYLILFCIYLYKRNSDLSLVCGISVVCMGFHILHDYYLLESYHESNEQWLYFSIIMLMNAFWFCCLNIIKSNVYLTLPVALLCLVPCIRAVTLLIDPYSTFLYDQYFILLLLGHVWFVYMLTSHNDKDNNSVIIEDVNSCYVNNDTGENYIRSLRQIIREHEEGRGVSNG